MAQNLMVTVVRLLVGIVLFGLVIVVGTEWMLWLKSNVESGQVQGGLFVLYLLPVVRSVMWVDVWVGRRWSPQTPSQEFPR